MRDHRFDNLRAFLLFLVVFGHLLELIPGEETDLLYRIIYSFHIPALLFVSGYFARFRRKKITQLLGLYLLFQTLYQLAHWLLFTRAEGEVLRFQYTTPYWLLWYLLTLITYLCLVPLFQTKNFRHALLILACSVVVSVVVGFDRSVGYYLSLSRSLVFLPFFAAGFYAASFGEHRVIQWIKTHKRPLCLGALAVLAAGHFLRLVPKPPDGALYGSVGYAAAGFGWGFRLLQLTTGFCVIGLLLALTPNKKIPGLTTAGRNTLTVFLVHGFLVRLAGKYSLFRFGQMENLLLAAVLAAVMLLILGSAWLNGLWKLKKHRSER